MVTLEQAVEEARKNGRVCPQPQKWNELYGLLPNRVRKGNCWETPLPLILAAWADTPALTKILRLREHIEWASVHGCLDRVHEFMQDLKEDEWYHLSE